MRWSERPVVVEVPATAANLGPGFDSFGLALSLLDRVSLAAAPAGLVVDVEGEGADVVPRDEQHLVVRAARAGFESLGAEPPGLRLWCRNAVPQGRGLGSSASAIVAGLVAARALVERSEPGAGRVVDDGDLLRLAARLEGHPDNVAAALLGGLTVAWPEPEGARAVRLEAAVSAVVLVPAEAVSTGLARGLLPQQVSHEDAAANSGRAGLLVVALTGRPDLLLPATEDRLHQDFREPVMPASLRLVHRLRAEGLAAVVSGAGPSVLVLREPAPAGPLSNEALVEALRVEAPGWTVRVLAVDNDGARTVD